VTAEPLAPLAKATRRVPPSPQVPRSRAWAEGLTARLAGTTANTASASASPVTRAMRDGKIGDVTIAVSGPPAREGVMTPLQVAVGAHSCVGRGGVNDPTVCASSAGEPPACRRTRYASGQQLSGVNDAKVRERLRKLPVLASTDRVVFLGQGPRGRSPAKKGARTKLVTSASVRPWRRHRRARTSTRGTRLPRPRARQFAPVAPSPVR
jgi:hypothetical protein